jgi:deazaflavin-dependent oxidoreductase (nitroreductase family)
MPEPLRPSDDDLFGQVHVRIYRQTGGERGYNWRGATILLLTTKGRATGKERTTPLIFRSDGERWVLIASQGGAPDHPQWYKNLARDPRATIQVKAERIPVRAHDATGDERERLWSLMTENWPAYDVYQRRTARQIPVVVLERA